MKMNGYEEFQSFEDESGFFNLPGEARDRELSNQSSGGETPFNEENMWGQLDAERIHARDAENLVRLFPEMLSVMDKIAIRDFCTKRIIQLEK